MDRLDSFDRLPSGMSEYYSSYGFHFSKRLCEFAVSKMEKKDESGKMKKLSPSTNDEVHELLKKYGVEVEHDKGYDVCYVFNMAKADYLGSSIPNEQNLAKFVKDYLDDPDGNPSRALDEYLANCTAKGVPIIWEDML